jgi:hypothetical protein
MWYEYEMMCFGSTAFGFLLDSADNVITIVRHSRVHCPLRKQLLQSISNTLHNTHPILCDYLKIGSQGLALVVICPLLSSRKWIVQRDASQIKGQNASDITSKTHLSGKYRVQFQYLQNMNNSVYGDAMFWI